MKTFKRAAIAAVIMVAAGLLVGVFALVRGAVISRNESGKLEIKAGKAVAGKDQLFGFAARDIEQIDIAVRQVDYSAEPSAQTAPPPKERQLGLAKVGGKWMLTKPLHALAAAGDADGLATAIADLQIRGRYDDVDPLAPEYGLNNPCVIAQVRLKSGKQYELRLGKDTAIESNVYLTVDSGRSVYYAASSVKTSLTKEPKDLREKKVVDFKEDKVRRVILDRAGTRVVCEQEGKKKEKEWWLTQPVRARADDFSVDDVVSALKGMEAKEFVDNVTSLTPYGLDKPDLTIRVDFGKKLDDVVVAFGKQIKKTVEAGAASPSTPSTTGALQDLVYCKARGRDEVLLIDAAVLGKLSKAPIDLRDKTIIEFTTTDIEQVTMVSKAAANFELTKKDAKWSFTKPAPMEADTSKVDNLLWSLKDIKAEDFLDDKDVSAVESGLEDPSVSITVTSKKQDRPVVVKIGNQERGGTRYYCQTNSMSSPVLVGGLSVDGLPKRTDDLKAAPAPTTPAAGASGAFPSGAPPSIPPPAAAH